MSNFKLSANQQRVKTSSLRNRMFVLSGGVCVLVVVGITLLTIFGLPLLGIEGSYPSRLRLAESSVNLIADHKKILIENWLSERHSELVTLARYQIPIEAVLSDKTKISPGAHLEKRLQDIADASPELDSLWLTELATGEVLAATNNSLNNSQHPNFLQTVHNSLSGYAVELVHTTNHKGCGVVFAQLVYFAHSEKPVAVLSAKADIAGFLQPLLHNVKGLGKSGEIVLLDPHATILVPLKGPLQDGSLARSLETRLSAPVAKSAAKGDRKLIHGLDYRGIEVIAATRRIQKDEQGHWGIIVKQERTDSLQPIFTRIRGIVVIGVTGILLLLASIYLIARRMTQPLHSLGLTADAVRSGDLNARAMVSSNDELGALADIFNAMVEQMSRWQADLEEAVDKKTEELSAAYQSLQRMENRRISIIDIGREYLAKGDLNLSLELLVARAVKFSGARAGRFLYCSTDNDEINITAVSKMCWADPQLEIQDEQEQAALEKYAQLLTTSAGDILVGTLAANKTLFFDAEQYLAARSIPLPTGHPAIESLMLVPVSVAGETLGVIAMANRTGGFGPEEEAGVEPFAAEAALLMHADSREMARSAAEETARLGSEFLANMSHELRTPLNVIIGMNQLLQGMNNSKARQDYLEKIGFSAKQLLALINDVLDLSRVAAGQKLVLESVVFEPEEVFFSNAQLLSFRLGDRKVELHVEVSREIPSRLVGDARRLTQILNNLLSNALKFTPKGSVILTVVPVNRTEEEITLGFSVIDTGIGMSEEQLGKVFQPFVQVDSSSTRQHGGSGLGLTISRQLCQLMGGDLRVESSLGRGSSFCFELPFQIDTDIDPAMKPLIPAVNLYGIPVLIADSSPACCDLLQRMLESMQFKVQSIRSASGALLLLNEAANQGRPYKLLLIGQTLDEMDGVYFAEQLVAQELPETRRILLANPAEIVELSTRLVTLALNGLVAMPARPSDLLDTIMNALGSAVDMHGPVPELSIRWPQAKILLVDDNEMGRQMARALLENAGIQVVEAHNGAEAVAKVEAENFDLVLMDIQMPVMDGLTATRTIRALDKDDSETLPIIAMTALSFPEHKAESLAAGMNDHITKPIELESLYTELQRWISTDKQQLVEVESTVKDMESFALEAALPGVDVQAGIRRAVGNRQMYLDLLKKFSNQFADLETGLQRELTAGKIEEALLRIHTLKGVAGGLGAQQLQFLAGQLEVQLTRQEDPAAQKEMLLEHQRLLAAINAVPELNQQETVVEKPNGTAAELSEILEQLRMPLKKLQAQDVKQQLARLAEKVWPSEYVDKLNQLERLVEQYQFGPATELVETLIEDGEI